MTAALCSVASVREYLGLETVPSSSKYSNDTIGSNIRAASGYLMRKTGRIFDDRPVTLKLTTNGKPYIPIPGLRVVSSVTRQGVALEVDTTYWLVPDVQASGVYTAIQLRAFRTHGDGPGFLANPEWFDRGLDDPRAWGGTDSSLPNDLVIVGDAGYEEDDMPEEIRHAAKVLAAYFTKRPDALLSGAVQTPDGSAFDLSDFPIEVKAFIDGWKVASFVEGLSG